MDGIGGSRANAPRPVFVKSTKPAADIETFGPRAVQLLVSRTLAENAAFSSLCHEALLKTPEAEFVKNFRRFLKAFHDEWGRNKSSSRCKAILAAFESRSSRDRISRSVMNRIVLFPNPHQQKRVRDEDDYLKRAGIRDITNWLKTRKVSPLNPFHILDMLSKSISDDPAFNSLLVSVRNFYWKPSSPSLMRVLLSLPRENITIINGYKATMIDSLRLRIDDWTGAKWDWWPLSSPQPDLLPKFSRITWVCHCKETMWQDVHQSDLVDYLAALKNRGNWQSTAHACLGKFQPIRPSRFKNPADLLAVLKRWVKTTTQTILYSSYGTGVWLLALYASGISAYLKDGSSNFDKMSRYYTKPYESPFSLRQLRPLIAPKGLLTALLLLVNRRVKALRIYNSEVNAPSPPIPEMCVIYLFFSSILPTGPDHFVHSTLTYLPLSISLFHLLDYCLRISPSTLFSFPSFTFIDLFFVIIGLCLVQRAFRHWRFRRILWKTEKIPEWLWETEADTARKLGKPIADLSSSTRSSTETPIKAHPSGSQSSSAQPPSFQSSVSQTSAPARVVVNTGGTSPIKPFRNSTDNTGNQVINVRGSGSGVILLGVEDGDGLADIAQLRVFDLKNDGQFFEAVKKEHDALRGFLRRYASIWRFTHCDFVKFQKFRPSFVQPRGREFPVHPEYEYIPRPPDPDTGISEHEFEKSLRPCSPRCRRALFSPFRRHRCILPSQRRFAIQRTPKKSAAWLVATEGVDSAWGINANYRPSALRVVLYHFAILAPGVWFMVSWLLRAPGDLQNASVPLGIEIGGLSLFWALFVVWGIAGENAKKGVSR